MAGVQHVELAPTAERDCSQNRMVGDLHLTAEALLALGERLIHLFQIRENQVTGLGSADSRRNDLLGSGSAMRNEIAVQDNDLRQTLFYGRRGRKRLALRKTLLHHTRRRSKGQGKMLEDGRRVPLPFRMQAQLRLAQAIGGVRDRVANLPCRGMHVVCLQVFVEFTCELQHAWQHHSCVTGEGIITSHDLEDHFDHSSCIRTRSLLLLALWRIAARLGSSGQAGGDQALRYRDRTGSPAKALHNIARLGSGH